MATAAVTAEEPTDILKGQTKGWLAARLARKREELTAHAIQTLRLKDEVDEIEQALAARTTSARGTEERLRDAAVELGEFTIKQWAKHADVSHGSVYTHLPKFTQKGMVEPTNHYKQGIKGSPARVYRYLPPTSPGPGNLKVPTEAELLEKVRRSVRPQVTHRTRPHVTDSQMDGLLAIAWAQDFKLRKLTNGHVRVWPKNKEQDPVTVGSTPSSYRSFANTRADLRNIGVDIP